MTFVSKTLSQVPSFLLLRLQHTYAGSHPNKDFKKDILAAKNGHFLLKNMLFKLSFQGEGHLDSNFLVYFLTTHRECFLFQFLSHRIRMDIPIQTEIQKVHISGKKSACNLLKKLLLKLYF